VAEQGTVLIAASNANRDAWMPVARQLERQGIDVIAYQSDAVASGRIPFDICLTEAGGTVARYDGRQLALDGLAAWWRQPHSFPPSSGDWAHSMSVNAERRATQDALWSLIPDAAWMNAPSRMRRAQERIGQLAMAHTVGFHVADTVVTNNWGAIQDCLGEDVDYGLPTGMLYTAETVYVLRHARVRGISDELLEHNPFPGYWQAHIPHTKERWVVVVGDRTFESAVYLPYLALVDAGERPTATFAREPLPDQIRTQCFELLKAYGLRFGSFDFVEDGDGRIILTSFDPNGEYDWLEEQFGFPIANTIANELASIARSRIR
jgi:hypothetical protein